MIQIYRSLPLARIDQKSVKLTHAEHQLLITLGMMDNRLVPGDLLFETAFDRPLRVQDDRNLLLLRIARLRQKIGQDHLQTRSGFGYILTGEICFIE